MSKVTKDLRVLSTSFALAPQGKRIQDTWQAKYWPQNRAGRQRCAEAKTIHGRETREARNERSLASARLAVLEWVGRSLGFVHGSRTRGAKPNFYSEVESELRELVKSHLNGNFVDKINKQNKF